MDYKAGSIAIILMISLLIITGCEENNTDGTSTSFIGGDDGLKIEFIKNAPPEEVFDADYPFSISLKMENIGEWDIDNPSDATVRITGINPLDFGKTSAELTKNVDSEMRAKRRVDGDVLRGTISNVEFQGLQYQGSVSSTVELPLRADVCYAYGTKANTKICVLEDLLGTERREEKDEVCDPNEAKDLDNSGAPVQVKNFRQSAISKDKLSFSFSINHVGSGVISKRGSECSDEIANKDKVLVSVNTGLSGLTCSGIEAGGNFGETTLYDGTREIVCTQPLPPQRSNYEKQISITLEYDYEDSLDTAIKVKPSIK